MASKLTELEGCTLGLVWELGPCTPYALRQVFLKSPNPQWSGSAGAIYPLMRRLEAAGVLLSREDFTGRRRRKLYEISSLGRHHLRAWISPEKENAPVGIPVDPLRTRIRFLGALSSEDRREFLRAARLQLRAQIRDAAAEWRALDPSETPHDYLVALGVRRIAEARLAWIEEAEKLLGP